jgi:hypothetical protein
MELLGKAVVLFVIGLVIRELWRALQPRRFFVVRIVAGKPRVVAGTVTAAFVRQIGEVAKEHGVTAGRVSGVERGPRIGLEISRQFPAAGRQQLRNWWAASGWGSRKGRLL